MNATGQPDPDEARASLEQIAEAHRAAAEATRRPAWFHAIFAATTGIGVGVATLHQPSLQIAGVTIIVVGGALLAVVEHHLKRRRGRILDERSVRSQPLRFFIPWLVVFGLTLIRPEAGWQPWYAIAAGILVALAGFVYLRWDENYQTRRLAAGDYDRYDLI
ncbi:MAG: hypothetical protein QM628_09335 [Propionicimonas sp.]